MNFKDKSYGTFIEVYGREMSTIYLVKSNIYCEIKVTGIYYYETKDDAKELAHIVLRKISLITYTITLP